MTDPTSKSEASPQPGEVTALAYRHDREMAAFTWDSWSDLQKIAWAAAEHRARTTGPLWEALERLGKTATTAETSVAMDKVFGIMDKMRLRT